VLNPTPKRRTPRKQPPQVFELQDVMRRGGRLSCKPERGAPGRLDGTAHGLSECAQESRGCDEKLLDGSSAPCRNVDIHFTPELAVDDADPSRRQACVVGALSQNIVVNEIEYSYKFAFGHADLACCCVCPANGAVFQSTASIYSLLPL
jgi:hypothetical protein